MAWGLRQVQTSSPSSAWAPERFQESHMSVCQDHDISYTVGLPRAEYGAVSPDRARLAMREKHANPCTEKGLGELGRGATREGEIGG
jgi:hypothetical protein